MSWLVCIARAGRNWVVCEGSALAVLGRESCQESLAVDVLLTLLGLCVRGSVPARECEVLLNFEGFGARAHGEACLGLYAALALSACRRHLVLGALLRLAGALDLGFGRGLHELKILIGGQYYYNIPSNSRNNPRYHSGHN